VTAGSAELPEKGEGEERAHSEYVPTRSQMALLQAYERGEDMSNIRAFCEAAGTTHPRYYEMLRDPEAFAWWQSRTTEAAQKRKAGVYDAIAREAERGNPAAMKLWLERFDVEYVPKSQRDTAIRAEVTALPAYKAAQIESEGGGTAELPGADGLRALPEPVEVVEVADVEGGGDGD